MINLINSDIIKYNIFKEIAYILIGRVLVKRYIIKNEY